MPKRSYPLTLALVSAAALSCLLLAACSAKAPPRYDLRVIFEGNPKVQELATVTSSGNIGAMHRLVSEGADPNAVSSTYNYPLIAWVALHAPYPNSEYNREGFRYLLELGANPNKTWKEEGQETSLVHELVKIARLKHPDFLLMALDLGHADPNLAVGESRESPIEAAVKPQQLNAFASLVHAGADIHRINPVTKRSLIIETALADNYRATLYLLQNGASPDIKYDSGGSVIDKIQSDLDTNKELTTDKRHWMHRWFWLCVDTLEKRGTKFTLTSNTTRPATLSTMPPLAGLPFYH
jgi:ankyrin repeat protein